MLKQPQVCTIVGDVFETITNCIFKSRIVSSGVYVVRTDLISNNHIIEVKSSDIRGGKWCFTTNQCKYYDNYYHAWCNHNEIDLNILFFLYGYNKQTKLLDLGNELEIIKHVAGNIEFLCIIDYDFFLNIRSEMHTCNYTWGHRSGWHISSKYLGDFIKKHSIFKRSISAFKIGQIQVGNFEVFGLFDDIYVEKNFKSKPSLKNMAIRDLPEYIKEKPLKTEDIEMPF